VLAETVAIMAGVSPMSWSRVALASLVASLPPALLYALTGAAAANFQSVVLSFGVVLRVTGLFWLIDVYSSLSSTHNELGSDLKTDCSNCCAHLQGSAGGELKKHHVQ
jgi:hypothetical protein